MILWKDFLKISYFPDTFNISFGNEYVPWEYNSIVWPSDRNNKFKNPKGNLEEEFKKVFILFTELEDSRSYFWGYIRESYTILKTLFPLKNISFFLI